MTTSFWAVIPAAGAGTRFSTQHLKQYQYIQHQTVLEHTLQRLMQLDTLAGCVLAVAEHDHHIHQLTLPKPESIFLCTGGQERVHSVLNALYYLKQHCNAHDDDWVMVHDAARPCVTVEQLNRLIQHVQTHQRSAILAIPVRDTLKKSHASTPSIATTVDRTLLWQAQTPQISRLSILIQAIERALADHVAITDEASALEYSAEPVDLVLGSAENLKITYPEDLVLADLILQAQIKQQP